MNNALQSIKRAQVDWRMVLMSAVLVVIALIFNILSDGIFMSSENLYNIAQQTAVVGILATVMVLIIVTRHIDLSVGSVMGFVGVLIALPASAVLLVGLRRVRHQYLQSDLYQKSGSDDAEQGPDRA